MSLNLRGTNAHPYAIEDPLEAAAKEEKVRHIKKNLAVLQSKLDKYNALRETELGMALFEVLDPLIRHANHHLRMSTKDLFVAKAIPDPNPALGEEYRSECRGALWAFETLKYEPARLVALMKSLEEQLPKDEADKDEKPKGWRPMFKKPEKRA